MAALDIKNKSRFVIESVTAALNTLEASKQGISPKDIAIRQLALKRNEIVKELTKLENDPVYLLHKEWLDAIVNPRWGRKSEWGIFEETGDSDNAPFFKVPESAGSMWKAERWDAVLLEKPVHEKIVVSHEAQITMFKNKLAEIDDQLMT